MMKKRPRPRLQPERNLVEGLKREEAGGFPGPYMGPDLSGAETGA